ncbi:major facilitator superfamily domain-containing protein [Aspergillus granulosus]|uniref:Major facilitator superfamily domain-containing protein n=1 Tax=Aspergillus granulosus TaxID=176169 RepID=A0ABR4HNX6_9EURO
MLDAIRDSPFGLSVRFLTKGKYLRHVEELDTFEHPYYYASADNSSIRETASVSSGSSSIALEDTDSGTDIERGDEEKLDENMIRRLVTQQSHHAQEKEYSEPIKPTRTSEGHILVDWYTTDDPENPQNWTPFKKHFVASVICFYSFVVYFGSSITIGAVPEVVEKFGISIEVSSLALALYVLGYGLGPLLFSPLSEIAPVGRNAPYIITLFIYTMLWIGAAMVQNFPGYLVLRFLTGFFGSPALATGGASFADMYPLLEVPYAIVFWGAATVVGPALAPVIANFSAPATSWHWVSWEMLWISAPVLLVWFFFVPETSASTILYYRARRLRRVTGNSRYRTKEEIDQLSDAATTSPKHILSNAIIKPAQINVLDPAVLFSTVYTSLVYAIFYSFFESFPLIFEGVYHFRFELTGLPFLAVLPALLIASLMLIGYWNISVVRHFPSKGFEAFGAPERRLVPGLINCLWTPIGLFITAWTSRPTIHWIVPIIGLSLTIIGTFTVILCMLQYLAFTYPRYAASLFAANDFARSTLAAGAVMFARPMFLNLGLDWGISLLAFVDIVCCVLLFGLWRYGGALRERSRFAEP